jgi:hypothetical protein
MRSTALATPYLREAIVPAWCVPWPLPPTVDVNLRDDGSPGGATFKLDVIDVEAGIEDVHVNTLTTGRVVVVESESSEVKPSTAGGTRKTLGSGVTSNHATRAGFRNVPIERSAECRRRE